MRVAASNARKPNERFFFLHFTPEAPKGQVLEHLSLSVSLSLSTIRAQLLSRRATSCMHAHADFSQCRHRTMIAKKSVDSSGPRR